MNEGRLKLVSMQTKRRRKFTAISNLLVRERHADYDGGLDRERVHVQLITKKHELQLKKSLVDLRSYSKCLRRLKQRDAANRAAVTTYFRDDVKSDIDEIIKENHPQARRFRRTQRLLQNGKSNGQLICPVAAMKQLDTIIGISPIPSSIQADDPSQHSRSKLVLPPINAYQSREQIKNHETAFQKVQSWIGNIQIKDADSTTHLPPLNDEYLA